MAENPKQPDAGELPVVLPSQRLGSTPIPCRRNPLPALVESTLSVPASARLPNDSRSGRPSKKPTERPMPTPEQLTAMANSPAEFRKLVYIDADGETRLLADVVEPWQEADFAAVDPALMRVAGLPAEGGKQRQYFERGRGHSKTTDMMILVLWLLLFCRRPVKGIAAAADLDQSKIGRSAFVRLLTLNPWMGEVLDVQTNKIINTRNGSELEFITSDAASSFGHLIDFAICDEVCHWKSEELWTSIFSAVAKKTTCLLIVGSNAGLGQSDHHGNGGFARRAGPIQVGASVGLTVRRRSESRRSYWKSNGDSCRPLHSNAYGLISGSPPPATGLMKRICGPRSNRWRTFSPNRSCRDL